ncbi:MAG: hypothetical protein GY835_19150 [bacterium]|nr:hypothetical protein [bacterium]
MSRSLNEETVKNRYLIPFLQRLGFNLSELSFEDRFTVRVGRSNICPSQATGFLDILVKRGDKNLFIVEAKREGEELTSDDRDQGISYASLVRPIAPYVLLTNGDDFQLYDTLSKEEVSEDSISPDSDFEIALPTALVEEAANYFLGLSKANLAAFSSCQVDEEIRPLLGSKDEPYRKFIPELFVASSGFSEAIDRFLADPKSLFVLVADSGQGKTCCICDLVRKRVAQHQPVLFYRGINLNGPILESVASDFGWTFSEELSAVNLIRRLERIASNGGLLIVIDGIDEWEFEGRRQDLLTTARRLSTTANVRLLVSCKATVWGKFSVARGQATGIEGYLYGSSSREAKGFALQPMSRREFSEALKKYRDFYGVGRAWEDVALDAAKRSPFFMRVLFEVAQNKGDEFIVLDSINFFENYLDQSIARLKQPEAARLLLISIAGSLFARGEERLAHADLVRRAGAAYSERVLRELIEYQILEMAAADSGMHISFYFSLLRDYVVTFHSERWQDAGASSFKESLDALLDRPVHQEALSFFYRYASYDKKRLMDSAARHRAEEILRAYCTIISTELRPLRSRFVPYTDGPIGYVGTFNPGTDRLGFCNFRKLGGDDDDVLLLPASYRRLYDSNLPHLYGAHGIIGVTAIGDSNPVDWVVNRAIGHQLRDIVEQGRLRESSDPRMVQETLAGIISRSTCGYSGEPHPARLRNRPPKYPRQKPNLFPLETKNVRQWLKYWLLYQHFREKRLAEKLANGEIPITEHESGGISYSADLSYQDMKDLDVHIASHMDLDETEVRRLVGPIQDSRLCEIDERVNEALDALATSGIEVLEDEVFPEHESLVRRGLRMESVCQFLEKAYSMAFEAFVSIAKQNFLELHQCFPSIRCQPIAVVLAVRVERGKQSWLSGATIYVCEGAGSSNLVVARPDYEVLTSTTRDPSWRFEIEVDGQRFTRIEEDSCAGVLGQRSVTLNRILYSGKYLGHDHGTSSSWAGTSIPSILRTLAYDWLRQELPAVFAELCRKYDTEMESNEWERFAWV